MISGVSRALDGRARDGAAQSRLPEKSTPIQRGATAGTVENRAEEPAQPPPERSRRTRRALQRRPPRTSAPTEPTGPPLPTPIGRTSARSGSVRQQCIRAGLRSCSAGNGTHFAHLRADTCPDPLGPSAPAAPLGHVSRPLRSLRPRSPPQTAAQTS